MPNAITLTHFRPKSKTDPLVPNPHFLSMDLLHTFLDQLAPLKPHLGPMMFQFEYLNREKIEESTGKEWNRIAEPRNADLDSLADVVKLSLIHI